MTNQLTPIEKPFPRDEYSEYLIALGEENEETHGREKSFVQFKDRNSSIINMDDVMDRVRTIYNGINSGDYVITLIYKDGCQLTLWYASMAYRDSDMRRFGYILNVRKKK